MSLSIQNDAIQLPRRLFPTCVAFVLAVGTARINSKNLSVITVTYWLPFVVLRRGSKMYMATNLVLA